MLTYRTTSATTSSPLTTITTCSSASTLLFEAATSAEAEASAPLSSTSSSTNAEEATHLLTQDLVSKLRFRELRRELADRQLPDDGTTTQLRTRLKRAVGLEDDECVVNEDGIDDDCRPAEVSVNHEEIARRRSAAYVCLRAPFSSH
jgi:hypothetical protein